MNVKVLVCGGRDFSNRVLLWDRLDGLHREHPFSCLIHGDYRGADRLADEWALTHGVQPVRCPANWQKYGVSAGPIRNEHMLELKPDIVVAFPGGSGTNNLLNVAGRSGVKIVLIADTPRV